MEIGFHQPVVRRDVQGVYRHESAETGTPMTFAVFVPEHAPGARLPVLWYLSGLTCTHANVMDKGEYRRACAEHGIVFVAPDTSPRGDEVPDDAEEAYDFGKGAGFYADAKREPWAANYRHAQLRRAGTAGADRGRVPGRHRAAGDHRPFDGRARRADRVAAQPRPVQVDQRLRADRQPARTVRGATRRSAGYLGPDRAAWREYDAVALIEDGARLPDLLVDQGTADNFLDTQLKTHLLDEALPQGGYARADPDAGWLRPFLLLHLDLHGRAHRMACGEA